MSAADPALLQWHLLPSYCVSGVKVQVSLRHASLAKNLILPAHSMPERLREQQGCLRLRLRLRLQGATLTESHKKQLKGHKIEL